jgi:hypothetical protein
VTAVVRRLASGVRSARVSPLSAKMMTAVPPEEIGRMMSGAEAAELIRQLIQGRGRQSYRLPVAALLMSGRPSMHYFLRSGGARRASRIAHINLAFADGGACMDRENSRWRGPECVADGKSADHQDDRNRAVAPIGDEHPVVDGSRVKAEGSHNFLSPAISGGRCGNSSRLSLVPGKAGHFGRRTASSEITARRQAAPIREGAWNWGRGKLPD